MKILHTSDWHIGKRLMERERLPEQVEALDEIVRICEEEKVELILVAGDVFDTYLPSSEAEEVFFRAVKRLAGDTRAVVAISGNHDDGIRLSASCPLAEEHGIYLVGNKPFCFSSEGNRPVRAVRSGEGYLVIQNESGEQVYINTLPYPNEARLKENKSDEPFADKISRWVERGEAGYDREIPHILLTHLFVAGGKTSESERNIDLGGARATPVRSLPDYGYIALGHLHRKQKIGNAYYSGSILQYSFDEADSQKGVYLLETKDGGFTEPVFRPLSSGRKLVRLQANGVSEALELLPRYENAFIELTLNLTEPLSAAETQSLRERAEGLVSLITRVNTEEKGIAAAGRSRLSAEELFDAYYQATYGTEPPEALKEALLEIMEDKS